MSGHNKWSSIKHKKGAADAKRGKLFSRLTKEIMLSAREGGGRRRPQCPSAAGGPHRARRQYAQ